MSYQHPTDPLLTLPIPRMGTRWLNLNGQRNHWADYRTKHDWKAITQLQIDRFRPPRNLPPCDVQFLYFFHANRRRDLANFIVDKPVIDQMVKAGIWSDDNAKVIRILPNVFITGKEFTEGVVVYAYPMQGAHHA